MNEGEALAYALALVQYDGNERLATHDRSNWYGIAEGLLASAWLRDHDAALVAQARSDEREQIARAIEAERNTHWQRHLREHPLADGKSCPRDYGIHDAYYRAAWVARHAAASSHPTGNQP